MTDKLIMENYLLVLKSTMEVYVHGSLESSNNDIKNILESGLKDTLKHQEKCYDEMTKYGWYTVNNVDSNSIKQIFKKVNNSK